MKQYKIEENINSRIDQYLSEKLDLTRSQVQKLIKSNKILVNNQEIKSSFKLNKGDEISLYLEDGKELKLEKKKIDLNIIYEDDEIIILDKEQGLTVHPNAHNQNNTLVNGLLYHTSKLGAMDTIRPGIVHRLDKETSGVMVIGKTDYALEKLMEDFKNRKVERYYIGITEGHVEDTTVNIPIGRDKKTRVKMSVDKEGGREAITVIKAKEYIKNNSLAEFKLITGRTHQIRVHLQYLSCPIVGDSLYGQNNLYGETKMMLHGYKLVFNHPRTGQRLEFKSEVPQRFNNYILKVKNN